jgi:hypothetical protein
VRIIEYKLRTHQTQRAAIDEAIRTVQFVRNKCLRLWMDGRGIGDNDLQIYCAQLAEHARDQAPGVREGGRRRGDRHRPGQRVAQTSAGVRTRITACPRPPFVYHNRPSRLVGRREARRAPLVVDL